MNRSTASPIAVWAGLITLYIVWGSTYLGMKVAIGTLPPFVMGFFRFLPAGLLLIGLMAIRHRGALPRPSRRSVIDAGIVGAFLLVGGTGLVAWGEQTVPTGIAALLIGLVPMWLAIFGFVLFRERIHGLVAVGILVGLAGVAILAWPVGGVGELDPAGLAALLLSSVLWSLGTLYAARRAVLPKPALVATGIEMVIGGLVFLVVAALTGETAGFDVGAVSATSWAGVLYLILVGSLIGFTTFGWLIEVAPLPRVSTYAYVNPVVAVFLGWLILGEPLTPRTILAAVVITVAVVLIVTARGRATSQVRTRVEPAEAGGSQVGLATDGGAVPAVVSASASAEPAR